MNIPNINFYIIVNSSGKYFKGNRKWTDDIKRAKFYTHVGYARTIATQYGNNDIQIIELTTTTSKIVDNTLHAEKTAKRKLLEEKRQLEKALKAGQERVEQAKLELEKEMNRLQSQCKHKSINYRLNICYTCGKEM